MNPLDPRVSAYAGNYDYGRTTSSTIAPASIIGDADISSLISGALASTQSFGNQYISKNAPASAAPVIPAAGSVPPITSTPLQDPRYAGYAAPAYSPTSPPRNNVSSVPHSEATKTTATSSHPGTPLGTEVIVYGLPKDVTVEKLASYFGEFGALQMDRSKDPPQPLIVLPTDFHGNFKGEARVSYDSAQVAALAISHFNGKEWPGHGPIRVEFPKPKVEHTAVPRETSLNRDPRFHNHHIQDTRTHVLPTHPVPMPMANPSPTAYPPEHLYYPPPQAVQPPPYPYPPPTSYSDHPSHVHPPYDPYSAQAALIHPQAANYPPHPSYPPSGPPAPTGYPPYGPPQNYPAPPVPSYSYPYTPTAPAYSAYSPVAAGAPYSTPAPGPAPRFKGKGGPARPGDWVCNSCGNVNFAYRTECKQCGLPKQSNSKIVSDSDRARPYRASKDALGDWICHNCNFKNFSRREVCHECQTPRPGSVPRRDAVGERRSDRAEAPY